MELIEAQNIIDQPIVGEPAGAHCPNNNNNNDNNNKYDINNNYCPVHLSTSCSDCMKNLTVQYKITE